MIWYTEFYIDAVQRDTISHKFHSFCKIEVDLSQVRFKGIWRSSTTRDFYTGVVFCEVWLLVLFY